MKFRKLKYTESGHAMITYLEVDDDDEIKVVGVNGYHLFTLFCIEESSNCFFNCIKEIIESENMVNSSYKPT
jgi:hypothetical protein